MSNGAYPCPIGRCSGNVGVRQIGEFKAFGCDGPEHHTDAQIRGWMLADDEKWFARNRREMEEIERRIDPVAWLHDRLDEATKPSTEKIHFEDIAEGEKLPAYATGFCGRDVGRLLHLHGMTTLSGKASSGKSWFALGAAISSALDGWEVHYLAAEANDVISRRVMAATNGRPPEMFTLHSAEPGVRPQDMIEQIRSWVVSRRTLIVIDSISTLLSLMRYGQGGDKWEAQDQLEMFLMRVRALTRGEIGIINVSEANAQGESKGRAIDHRSDVSVNFKSMEDSDAKEIRVTKAWEAKTGLLGRANVSPTGLGLELIYDGPTAYATSEGDGF